MWKLYFIGKQSIQYLLKKCVIVTIMELPGVKLFKTFQHPMNKYYVAADINGQVSVLSCFYLEQSLQ